MLHDKVNKLL